MRAAEPARSRSARHAHIGGRPAADSRSGACRAAPARATIRRPGRAAGPRPCPVQPASRSARATCAFERARPLRADRARCAARRAGRTRGRSPSPPTHADQFEAAAAEIADDAVGVGNRRTARPCPRAIASSSPESSSTCEPERLGAARAARAPFEASRTAAVATVRSSSTSISRASRGEARQRAPRASPALPRRSRRSSPAPRPSPAITFSLNRIAGSRGGALIDDEADRVGADVDDRGARLRRRLGTLGGARNKRSPRLQRPRASDSLGTARRSSSAAPRPGQRRVGHEIAVQVERLARPARSRA